MLKKFVCLNIETTGLDVENDEIIRISAVKFDTDEEKPLNDVLQKVWLKEHEFDRIVKPQKEIPKAALELLQLDDNQDLLFEYAPTIDKALSDFDSFIGDMPIVAHSACFASKFLIEAYKRFLGKNFANEMVCTLVIAKQLAVETPSFQMKNYTLQHLMKFFFNLENGDCYYDTLDNGLSICYSIFALYNKLNKLNEMKKSAFKLGIPHFLSELSENVLFNLLLGRVEDGIKMLCDDGDDGDYMLDLMLALAKNELIKIGILGLTAFFITMHDIIMYAKSVGTHYFVGGSANSSVVCYALGITRINPYNYNLNFSCFINAAQPKMPNFLIKIDSDGYNDLQNYVKSRHPQLEHIEIIESAELRIVRKTVEAINKDDPSLDLYQDIRLYNATSSEIFDFSEELFKFSHAEILRFLGEMDSDFSTNIGETSPL